MKTLKQGDPGCPEVLYCLQMYTEDGHEAFRIDEYPVLKVTNARYYIKMSEGRWGTQIVNKSFMCDYGLTKDDLRASGLKRIAAHERMLFNYMRSVTLYKRSFEQLFGESIETENKTV